MVLAQYLHNIHTTETHRDTYVFTRYSLAREKLHYDHRYIVVGIRQSRDTFLRHSRGSLARSQLRPHGTFRGTPVGNVISQRQNNARKVRERTKSRSARDAITTKLEIADLKIRWRAANFTRRRAMARRLPQFWLYFLSFLRPFRTAKDAHVSGWFRASKRENNLRVYETWFWETRLSLSCQPSARRISIKERSRETHINLSLLFDKWRLYEDRIYASRISNNAELIMALFTNWTPLVSPSVRFVSAICFVHEGIKQ